MSRTIRAEQFRIIMPFYEHFQLYRPMYDQSETHQHKGADIFLNTNISSATVQSHNAELISCLLFDLTPSKSSISNEDASKIYTNIDTKADYEIRALGNSYQHWGRSTTTGKGREPKKDASREVWEQHHKDVIYKPEHVEYYVICDIRYAPFFHITRIHSSVVLNWFYDGIIKYNDPEEKQRFGLIKNKFSANQFYKWTYGMNSPNPFLIQGWQNFCMSNMDDDSIRKNISNFHNHTTNKVKKSMSKSEKAGELDITSSFEMDIKREDPLIKEFIKTCKRIQ